MSGTLYVVATPIGNLEDITRRALRVLGEVKVVACEDTRRTRTLLTHFGLATPTVSYHEHNESSRAAELIARLLDGESVALVSDAGTPCISDPGYRLVREAAAAGIDVVPIPGASAAVTALSASGLATDAFLFVGFLPSKRSARKARLAEIAGVRETIVFYEAPHRIGAMLEDLREAFGDREIVVAREITKLHEEIVRGSVSEVTAKLTAERHRGEFVVVVEGASDRGAASGDDAIPARERVAELEAEGLTRMDAVKRVAKERGLPKREVYREVVGDDSGDA
ncbi:MAG: 16S rRNA (cytidine(1402)-2'-O)-methyltransferase [Blastocatellia bacterium]|nr:16S rRNA (cytidine(1402)-2'-O)-methyltransferase [Blastocatellia bacterium]